MTLKTLIPERFRWELLGFLRQMTVLVTMVFFVAAIFAVAEKLPWIGVLLAAAMAGYVFRRWQASDARRTAGAVSSEEQQAALDSSFPDWLDGARCYYSEIGEHAADPVRVFVASDETEVTNDSRQQLTLRLEPQFRASALVQVFDAHGREEGIIRSEGILPGITYTMHRNGQLVWTLSVRSIVRKRHSLELTNSDSWTFETPFFWWQNLTGTALGTPKILGGLALPTARVWTLWIEPGRDTIDVLAAVAFLHRQWWRW